MPSGRAWTFRGPTARWSVGGLSLSLPLPVLDSEVVVVLYPTQRLSAAVVLNKDFRPKLILHVSPCLTVCLLKEGRAPTRNKCHESLRYLQRDFRGHTTEYSQARRFAEGTVKIVHTFHFPSLYFLFYSVLLFLGTPFWTSRLHKQTFRCYWHYSFNKIRMVICYFMIGQEHKYPLVY